MHDEIREYIAFLSKFTALDKPKMPKFDLDAYTDNEYLNAIDSIMRDYENVDDEYLTIRYIKGE